MSSSRTKITTARIRRAAALFVLLLIILLSVAGADGSKPHTTRPPLVTEPPVSEPETPPRDAEGFLQEEGEFIWEDDEGGLWMYLNPTLQVIIRRCRDKSVPLIWFETEVFTRGEERFRTVLTDPSRPGKKYKFPYTIAQEAGFVLGFSDDFFADRMANDQTVGIIIREGQVISEKTNRKRTNHLPNLDMLIQYPDGNMEVAYCTEYTAEELIEKGVVNVFSFGPILIRDGEIDEKMYSSYYRDLEPRQALGMIEPGHYLLLSVQGRKEEDSKGTMLQRVAEMMKERGVMQALNLDGGNTMALIFRGRMLNKEAKFQNRRFVRSMPSLIGIGTTAIP